MGTKGQLQAELSDTKHDLQTVRVRLDGIKNNEKYPDAIRNKAGRICSALGIDVDELDHMMNELKRIHKEA